MVTGLAVGAGAATTSPEGHDGVVGPKPVPNSMTVSPGLAPEVVNPANSPGFATMLPSWWRAATYFRPSGSSMKSPGA
jgi:hypothetical protein